MTLRPRVGGGASPVPPPPPPGGGWAGRRPAPSQFSGRMPASVLLLDEASQLSPQARPAAPPRHGAPHRGPPLYRMPGQPGPLARFRSDMRLSPCVPRCVSPARACSALAVRAVLACPRPGLPGPGVGLICQWPVPRAGHTVPGSPVDFSVTGGQTCTSDAIFSLRVRVPGPAAGRSALPASACHSAFVMPTFLTVTVVAVDAARQSVEPPTLLSSQRAASGRLPRRRPAVRVG